MKGRGYRPAIIAAALVAAVLAVSGAVAIGVADQSRVIPPSPALRPPPPIRLRDGPPAHVAIIVMENEDYASIIGSRAAPFITSLARRYSLASGMYATSHPSLPNYLALTGGSTFGISSDCTDCTVSRRGIPTQLAAAGITWKTYMEGLPKPCFTGSDAGPYAKKHDPFMYFASIARNRILCSHVVPFMQLALDERGGALPRFIWITPNLCHDMHDCSIWTGDRFLAGVVPALLRSLGRNGVLFLTWDEGSTDDGCCRSAHGGHVATIVAGPGARRGVRMSAPTDQYSVLQAVEDLLGLPRLRYAACRCTPSLAPLLSGGRG